jgi:hypothetical protein
MDKLSAWQALASLAASAADLQPNLSVWNLALDMRSV